MATDWKPSKRIIDQEAIKRKLLTDGWCRICAAVATEGHHVLLRSQRGDDVPDNIIPLCLRCHRAYHDGAFELVLKRPEWAYLKGKLTGRAEAYAEKRRLVLR